MNLILTRFCYADFGTFGEFSLPDGMTLATVERPWLNNTPSQSCIPVGEYLCKPRRYNRGGYDAVEVTDVPGRSYILFHIGNFISNSKGCILVNSYLQGDSRLGLRGVSSKTAFNSFMEHYGGKEFTLSIQNIQAGVIQAQEKAA